MQPPIRDVLSEVSGWCMFGWIFVLMPPCRAASLKGVASPGVNAVVTENKDREVALSSISLGG